MRENKGIFLKPEVINLLLIFAVFVAVSGFLNDIKNTNVYGGIDLRNRIVGARLIELDKDPYFFKWNDTYSDKLRDPNDIPGFEANRVTVTPGTLQIYSLFDSYSYKFQRNLWSFFQWLLLLGTIFLFTLTTKNNMVRKLIWIINLFFIAGSYIWRIHIERGQIYVLYAFLIALSYFFLKKQNNRFHKFLAGLVLGYAAVLRPPIILFAIPFLIRKKWNFILGKITGLVIGITSTLLYAGLTPWLSYFKAMPLHRKLHLGYIDLKTQVVKDVIIENMDNIGLSARLPISNYSIQSIFYDFFDIRVSSFILGIGLVFVIMFALYFIIKFNIKSYDLLFLYSSILLLISEFFVPAPRFSYNNVIWIIPISLTILLYEGNRKYEK